MSPPCCRHLPGSLANFKTRVSGPISRGNEEGASLQERQLAQRVAGGLSRMLSQVLLRRTQADTLRGSLPPRVDVIIFCEMGELQKRQYSEAAAGLLR